jgi:hypothetical protein
MKDNTKTAEQFLIHNIEKIIKEVIYFTKNMSNGHEQENNNRNNKRIKMHCMEK